MAAIIKGVLHAAGLSSEPDAGSTTKLESFLTTLVTYPFLHLAATAPTKQGLSSSKGAGPVSSGADQLVRVGGKQQGSSVGTAGVESTTNGLNDYAEGKALVTLEKWCSEPVLAGRIDDTLYKAREWLASATQWQQEDLAALLKQLPPPGANTYNGGGPSSSLQPHEVASSFTSNPQVKQALVKAMQLAGKGLDMYLGPNGPQPALDQVVLQQLAAVSQGGYGSQPLFATKPPAEALSPEVPTEITPVERLAATASPNVKFITHQLQRKFTLSRSKTLVEWLNVLLGVVRLWLNTVAMFFYMLATVLRLGGNALSALGGLVAFTVVLSIAISVLSALTFLSASAADATGTFIEFMARFTDLAKRRTNVRRAGPAHLQDKMGPQVLPAMTFEELEDFFALQLTHAGPLRNAPGVVPGAGSGGPGPNLRNRPDVPRLANDPLLVMSYDAGLVDGSGALQPNLSLDEVASLWDPQGFFGSAGPLAAKAGAVLLLRLLAWKHIASIMAPPAAIGAAGMELERALRFVFVAGVKGTGVTTLYRSLTGMPQQYQVKAAGQTAEMKPILHHRSSFALLCRDDSASAQWITRPNHGIVSCLVFVVSGATSPTALGLSEPIPAQNMAQGAATTPAPAPAGSPGGSANQLDMVWQVLALRRPVLLMINKANELGKQADNVLAHWRSSVKEEAARRGLEAEGITVMLTELLDVPPPGAVGAAQIQDWLATTLAQSPQQR